MPNKGFFDQVSDTFGGLGLYQLTNLLSGKQDDPWGAIWRPFANSVGNIVDAVLPGDWIPDFTEANGKDYRGSWSDVLQTAGADEGWQKWGGLAGDILLDPTNLLGVGLVGKGAKLAGRLGKAGMIADEFGKAIPLASTLAGQADQGARALLKIGIPFTGKEYSLIKGQPFWNMLTNAGERLGTPSLEGALKAGPSSMWEKLLDSFGQHVYQPIKRNFYSPSGTGEAMLDEILKNTRQAERVGKQLSNARVQELLGVISKYDDPSKLMNAIETGTEPGFTKAFGGLRNEEVAAGLLTPELGSETLQYAPRMLSQEALNLAQNHPEAFADMMNQVAYKTGLPLTPDELNEIKNFVPSFGGRFGVGIPNIMARKFRENSIDEINKLVRETTLDGKNPAWDLFVTDPRLAIGKRIENSARAVARAKVMREMMPGLVQDTGTRRVEDVLSALKFRPDIAEEWGIAGKYVPENVHRYLTGAPEDQLTGFGKNIGNITDMIKRGQTTISASFHGRNAAGAIIMNALEDGGSLGDIARSIWNSVKAAYGGISPEALAEADRQLLEYGTKFGYINEWQKLWGGKSIIPGSFGAAEQVIDRGGVEDLVRLADKMEKGGKFGAVKNTLNPINLLTANPDWLPVVAGQKIGSNVEFMNRFAAALDVAKQMESSGLYKHLSPEAFRKAAWDAAEKTQIDYLTGFSPGDRVMRQIFPYWSWTKEMLPRMAKYAVTNPKAISTPFKLGGGNKRDDATLPEWLRDQFAIPVGDNKYMVSLGLPQEELFKLGQAKNIVSMLNPVFRTPIETATDWNIFKERPISSDTAGSSFWSDFPGISELVGGVKYKDDKGQTRYGVQNPLIKYGLENVPAVGTLGRMYGRTTDARKDWWENVLNTISGLKTANIDPELEKIRSNYADIEELMKIFGARGEAKEFKAPYLTQLGKMSPQARELMDIVNLQRKKKPEEAKKRIADLMKAMGL